MLAVTNRKNPDKHRHAIKRVKIKGAYLSDVLQKISFSCKIVTTQF